MQPWQYKHWNLFQVLVHVQGRDSRRRLWGYRFFCDWLCDGLGGVGLILSDPMNGSERTDEATYPSPNHRQHCPSENASNPQGRHRRDYVRSLPERP